jgi:hypothetical protein
MSQLKLPIQLVPKTSWWDNARSELDCWYKVRKQVYREYDYKCGVCGEQGPKWPVEGHEIWKYNENTKVQSLDDIVARCPACHKVHHIGYAKVSGNFIDAKRRFKRINDLSDNEVEQEIKKAYAIWYERNEIDWTLDLSYIEQEYGFEVPSKYKVKQPNDNIPI